MYSAEGCFEVEEAADGEEEGGLGSMPPWLLDWRVWAWERRRVFRAIRRERRWRSCAWEVGVVGGA